MIETDRLIRRENILDDFENLYEDLLFYKEYEQFYDMAKKSDAFKAFCKDAFGEDFSQDGFSDINQINRILKFIPNRSDVHILDVGCGNGKMLGYLQEKTGAYIHGFDFSKNAIETAKERFGEKGDFVQGCIGEVEYSPGMFDVITAIDTMYFAPDMSVFVKQLLLWLKKDGVLFVCYQEGDVMPKTGNAYSTVLAKALIENGISFDVFDITGESYELLLKKRSMALAHEADFVKEGNGEWFHMLIAQTDYANGSYEAFAEKMARYIYVIRK